MFISGDDEVIEILEDIKEADDNQIETGIYPLVRALNDIKGIDTFESCAGHPEDNLRPYIDFHISEHFERLLTNIVTSLHLSNRETIGFWYIEPFIHAKLAFTLKPFVPVESTQLTEQIIKVQIDIPKIAKNLKQHRNLGWWRK